MPHIFNTLPQSLFFSQVAQTMGSIASLLNQKPSCLIQFILSTLSSTKYNLFKLETVEGIL